MLLVCASKLSSSERGDYGPDPRTLARLDSLSPPVLAEGDILAVRTGQDRAIGEYFEATK
jgi:hypothetical protein